MTCQPFFSLFSLFSFVYSFGLLSLSTCTYGFFHLQYPERSGTAFGHKSFKFIIGGPRETNEGCFQIFSAQPWGCDSLSISDVLIPINPPLICILEILPLPSCIRTYFFSVFFFSLPPGSFLLTFYGFLRPFFTVYSWSELYLRSWHAHSLFEHPPLFHYHSAFPSVSGEVWVLWVLGSVFCNFFFFSFHDGLFTSHYPSFSVQRCHFGLCGALCVWRYQFVWFFCRLLSALITNNSLWSRRPCRLRIFIYFLSCHDGLLWREDVGDMYVA